MSAGEKIPVITVVGPTASGKSELAMLLARRLGGEIISADSMQVYRKMDIGTAKPSAEDRAEVRHHMIDVADPAESYSVSRYVDEASAAVKDVFSRGKPPIIAGGTGLYVDTLLSGTRLGAPGKDEEIRKKLEREAAVSGGAELKKRLAEFDPVTAGRLHDNDIKRIIRATEVYMLTGRPMSWWDARSKSEPSEYEPFYIMLTASDRKFLYDRIDKRVDRMFEEGLEREVKALLESGVPHEATSLQAIGYKEAIGAIEAGEPCRSAAEQIKKNSRRYAKRQLTWFNRNEKALRFPIDEYNMEEIYNKIQKTTALPFYRW